MYDQRVEICWRDAHDGAPQGWHEPEELDRDPCIVRTVGWLIPHHKPGHATVCSSWSTTGHIAEVTCIPLGMVQRIHSLTPNVVLPVEPEEPA